MEDAMQVLARVVDEDKASQLIKELDAGYGTYKQVDKLAEIVGIRMAKELVANYSPERLEEYAKAAHRWLSEAGDQAQTNLNAAAKIGMKPLHTKYPKAKVRDLANKFAGMEPDAVKASLGNDMPTLTMVMVDVMAEYNMDFQAKAGLGPVIVRTWSGSYGSHDTRHTDWCHDLAGTYDYNDRPPDVFVRHEGCRCTVEYYPNRNAEGRITALAKGEVDREGVLWNTKQETLEKRIRNMARKMKK